MRATVVMTQGQELDKVQTEKAFKAKGLPMKSFDKVDTPVPALTYQLTVKGTG